jgi:drug/metabolite transporter (DMT)-like permease
MRVWIPLSTVYVVWGSTYLAIRVMVETVPPLLGAGARFGFAGLVLVVVVALRRGRAALRVGTEELRGALVVGTLLCGANAVVTVAEQEVPSAIAALLVATIPLWVVCLRRSAGERVTRAGLAGVLVGFGGVALLMLPGEQTAGASLPALLAIVGAALAWACGSFLAPRSALPADPFASTGWQMLLGGLVCVGAGVLAGEPADADPARFSAESVLAFAYLVVFGSWLAFTAYAWLLQHAPLATVSTYAYVNPVVAIVLGWLILGEVITSLTLAGAAIIVASVAVTVRREAPRR